MRAKKFIQIWLLVTSCLLVVIGLMVVIIDPFFHYHKPLSCLYYKLENQRYKNDGIIKNFDYDAIVTGTSMAENFKTTEIEKNFNVRAIKVPFSGGTYRELNSNVEKSFLSGHKLKIVIRPLDENYLIVDKHALRDDLGRYPWYLYDEILLNDINYLWNGKALHHCVNVLLQTIKKKHGGLTSFDEYSNWMKGFRFGKQYVLGNNTKLNDIKKDKILQDEDILLVTENIKENVTKIANEHPETTFYYFFPPYSIVWWKNQYENGTLKYFLQAKKIAVNEIVKYKNIKLFSFYLLPEIFTNLDNYKDATHYGEWINSLMIKYFKNDIGLITQDNYEEFLQKENDYFTTFDYRQIF